MQLDEVVSYDLIQVKCQCLDKNLLFEIAKDTKRDFDPVVLRAVRGDGGLGLET